MEQQLVTALIGAIVVISTYLLAIVKFRQDLCTKYDRDLRDKRVTH